MSTMTKEEQVAQQLEVLKAGFNQENIDQLKKALELGKWADGTSLSEQEKLDALELIIIFDSQHQNTQSRVGYIHKKGD